MSPASDVLSPLAAPYYPSQYQYPIFCNGVPVGTVNTHEAIYNITDQALDEAFPPSAIDAAELDASDDFVSVMVDLSFIEDREEKGRSNLGYVASKRWETKRREGLKGKPYVTSYGRVERVNHENKRSNHNEIRLLPHRRHFVTSVKGPRNPFIPSRRNAQFSNQRSTSARYSKPIQQPRKQN
mmetsp:Transcript_16765/g.20483  ORF Transcript_16765/g.20483 Transcript_16765/m.20483 type:complete len:183 (+) Transcript_16765:137-685(+)